MEGTTAHICTSCCREFEAAASDEVFCVYCGAKQSTASAAPPSEGERARLFEAYISGDYERVVRETYEGVFEACPSLGLLRTASLYFTARETYLREAGELAAKRSPRSFLGSLFNGRNEYAENPMHREFFDSTERLMDDMALMLAKDKGEEGPKLALQLTRSLLEKKSEKEWGALYWPLLAIEHRCLPLLPFISTEGLRELYEEYSSYYKRYERVPNQERVMAAMKAELERR